MDYEEIIFSGHAVRQMFVRQLGKDDIIAIVKNGQIIADYPNDKPYPSSLMLGFVHNKPIHVVFAFDKDNKIGIVITTYIPDAKLWTDDFRSRRLK